ncbi:MAG: hypothetical protein IJN48_05015 [Clostridia bacterium]|nr:hypothetical protein [Clostridia bacterium]
MEQKNHSKKKHTVRNVLLIILALLVIAAGVLFLANYNHIMRLYKGVSHTSEEISSMQSDNDKKTNELLNELAVETMRDLTEDERKLLASGELSESDALSLIQGLMPPLDINIEVTEAASTSEPAVEITSAPSVSSDNEQQTTEVVTTTATSTSTTVKAPEPLEPNDADALQDRVSEIIAEIYLLRATYLNKIDELIYNTKLEYVALPKEHHNLQGKMRIIEKTLIPKGNALEAECDKKMNVLLDELKGILIKLNSSTAIIDEIKKTYEEQKDLKMAELYNKYSSKIK